MPDRNEIEAKILDIVAAKMDKAREDIQLGMSFTNDIGCDSLDTVEIMMEIEDAFGLSIPEEDAEKIQTVGEAVDYAEKRLKA